MKQKSGKMFNLFIVLSMLLGMIVTPALAASGSEVQSAPAAPVTQEDAAAKIDPQVLLEIKESGATEFFVWMKEKADLSPAANLKTKQEKGQFVFEALRATAERTQKDLRAVLDAQGVEYRSFYIANKVLVRSGGEVLAFELASRPDVAKITPNQKYQLQEPFKSTDVPESPEAIEPNITFIYAPDVWGMGIDGQGTLMAGNDTGLDWDHPAIINKYRGWDGATADHNYNWWDATGTYPSVPNDGHGHGTHTTGTMVGDDGAGNQIGVAPGAQTVHCKNMTDGGSGDDGTFSECFEWDLAPWDLTGSNPNPALAPDAINNSWGYWGGNAPQFEDEVDALQAAGIVVEVSAGNEGSACTTLRSPGDYQQVMTTGSVNHAAPFPGSLTGFSSRGPSLIDPADYMPDIMAPGENIRSSVPGGGYEGGWSGTSMAGPHATALIGLMWDANPALKGQVDLTYQIIQETAEPLTGVTGSNCGGDYTVGPNNDWGFGTINALAAVEAAIALGGAGFLEGTVTDSSTSDPLAGVSIVATKSPTQTYSTMTDEFGYYGKYLPEGTYEVDASKFGYIPETVTDVVITENVTETLDFALDPAPSATVYGYVYDSTTGWPLYAQIDIAGVPDGTLWNDPVTGYYEVTLPRGTTYDFHIEAWVGGYLPYDVSIGPLDGDTEENFYLAADMVACNAPGYELQAVAVMTEYFDAVTPPALPAGWAAADVNGTVGEWQTNAGTVHPPGGGTHSAPNLAYFNSYSASSGSETRLYQTADMDLSGLTDAQVWLWMYHDTGYSGNNDRVQLQVSTDAGATWQNAGAPISRYDGSVGWKQHTVDISAYAGLAGVRVGLLGTSAYGNDVHVDDVGVFQTSCLPLEGGLVAGNVYDANTLDDLTGATVENEAGYVTIAQETADPAVGDAFYTLFSPGGEQTFTASFTDAYGSDVEVVDVVGGSTVEQDFYLGAGWLVPDPDALSVDVELYQTDTVSLTLYNLGDVDLTFEINEKDEGFVPGVLAGEDILVVAYDTMSAPVAEAALTALGYSYLEVTATTFAAMPVEDLLEYMAVVYIGIPYTGGPQEKAMEYMDAGGSFMVADNDLGWSQGGTVLYTTYLQSNYVSDAGSDGVVVGTDIMAGISTDISGDPYPDDFTAGPDGVGIFDAPSGNLAGIRVERNDYLAVYLAWDFYYTGAAQQVPIMEAAMSYLTFSDVPWLSTAPITGTIPGGMPSFDANQVEAGVSSTVAPQGYAPKLTQSSFAPDSPAAGVVAVFKDVDPWGSTSTEAILAANSIPYEVHGSAEFATLDFSAYGMIIISSDQTQAFYDAYALNVAKFEAYVNGGGVLNFFAADYGWNGGFLNAPLPGGITYTFLGENNNVVDDPAHPVVAGIPNPFAGSYASHGVFSNLPAGAHVIASGQGSGSPTILEYQMGSGRLLAFATTLEISYDYGWQGGPILPNTLLYGYNQAPNNWQVVDVTFDASVPEVPEPGTYLAELQIKNNTPYGKVTVPVTMNVTAPAYLGKLEGTVNSMGYCDSNPFPAEGALVVIESSGGITYTATADASGYYYKWLDEAGSPYTVSVTAPQHDPGYADGVIIVGQGTTTQDFDLRWLVPCVGSDPDALSATLQLGASETQVLTLENAGGGAMDFEFQERDQGMIPMVKSSLSLPASDGNFPRGDGVPSFGAAPVSAGNPVAPSAMVELPSGTMAYAVEAANSYFTAFDLDIPQVLPNLAPYTTVDFPGAGEYVDGYVYVVDGTTMKQLDLTGAVINTIPVTPPPGSHSYTGMALDPTDGTVYLASCDITTSNLYTFDVATGTVTPIGQITNSPCTIGIAVDGTGAMYGHDIVADSLIGIDKATGAGTVIGSLGFDANFGQGMGWDPATDTLYLAAFNYSTFLAELRIADRSTGNTVMVGVLGQTDPGGTTQVPFLAVPIEIGGDVPWLSEDPLAGTVPADDSLATDITFDAGQVTQPGEYYADLVVSSNDPENNKYAIPVVMTVTAPEDWGKLEGTVTSLGYCDANPALVEGAEVLVTTGSGMTYTLTTDVNGYYVSWFPESESPLTIKVTAVEHTEGYAEDVVITGGVTTTQDFDLRWLMPCVGADPTIFSVDVPEGTLLTENLALTNSGAKATSFEVSEQPVTGAATAAPAKVTPLGSRLDLSLSGSPNLAGAAQPWAPTGDVELLLDDGSAEDSIGLTAGGQFIWFNRFTPTEDQFPLVIDQISLLMNNTTAVGASLQILVYEDTDGDGDPATGAVLLGYEYVTVQYNDMMTWNVYDLTSPVTLFGPGDVLIGVVNRSGSSGLLDFPAAIDQSPSSQYRSWIGYYGANPPEEPAFPAPDLWGIIDDFGLPGNWTLRASGYTGSQDVPWLSEDPITGTLEADSVVDIAVTFDSMTYTVGTTLDAMLKVKTDDPFNGTIEIPVTMNVVAWEYGVDAMLENDALSGVPGVTVTYTVMVTNTGNVSDVFDVVVSDDDWTTQAPPSVALGAGESAAVQVTVEIPADAADGDWDEATCTFTSQGDPTKSAAATMTTTAEVPYEFGVELAPATDAKAGAPGAMVAYVLQLTNTGDITDTFDLAVGSVEGWLVDFSAIEFTLGAGEMAEVTVHVTVPADAVEGDGDVTTVTATSQGDGSVAATSELTTTAVFPKIFLPVIPQGFTTP